MRVALAIACLAPAIALGAATTIEVCLQGSVERCTEQARKLFANPRALHDVVERLEAAARFDHAVALYAAALKRRPGDGELQRRLATARSNRREQRWIAERRKQTTATRQPSRDASDAVRQCHQLRGRDALAACRAALALNPAAPALHERRGDLLRGLGAVVEALAAYDSALALTSNTASLQRKRAAVATATGVVSERPLALPAAPLPTGGTLEGDAETTRAQLDLLAQMLADSAISRQQFDRLRGEIVAAAKPDANPRYRAVKPRESAAHEGRYRAILIGNQHYERHPDLYTPAEDVRALATVLERDYGFTVTVLSDATRRQMVRRLREAASGVGAGDSLLIYFAGHGELSADAERGYWLPSDADASRPSSWISDAFVSDLMHRSRARHVLVIADSCFSGTLATRRSKPGDDKASGLPSRSAMTAGALEPVLDSADGRHSVFASGLLAVLTSTAIEIPAREVFTGVRQRVLTSAEQVPRFANLPELGHRGGQFVFRRLKP